MTTLVWVLVTIGGYGSNDLVYSPVMMTKESCIFFLQNSIRTMDTRSLVSSQCIQIEVRRSL